MAHCASARRSTGFAGARRISNPLLPPLWSDLATAGPVISAGFRHARLDRACADFLRGVLALRKSLRITQPDGQRINTAQDDDVERVDRGRASDQHRRPDSSASALGWIAQLLRSRGMSMGSAGRWDITRTAPTSEDRILPRASLLQSFAK